MVMRAAGGPLEGLGGVGDEVHHHLTQLRRVALDRGELLGEAPLDGHRRRRDRVEEVRGVLEQAVEVEPADDEAPLARVGEELLGQVGGAHRGVLDVLELLAHRRLRRQLAQGEVGVTEHGDEQVVEVVGDPAGEHAQALELLRLLQLRLELLRVGVIRGHEQEADEAAPFVHRRGPDGAPHLGAVLVRRRAMKATVAVPPAMAFTRLRSTSASSGNHQASSSLPSSSCSLTRRAR